MKISALACYLAIPFLACGLAAQTPATLAAPAASSAAEVARHFLLGRSRRSLVGGLRLADAAGDARVGVAAAGARSARGASNLPRPVLLNPALLLQPPTTAWPTYNGDYSGRRYSTLDQITAANVRNLAVAWIYPLGGGRGAPVQGGIDATPLMVDGVLYFSVTNHVFAVDARTGVQLWRFDWVNHGGHAYDGNRGLGMYGNWLYWMTPDDNLVSLDARTGKLRWKKQISDPHGGYFSSVAPIVVKGHVIVGAGGDTLDLQAYLEARDPVTGAFQWRWNVTPGPGQPGANTWPNPKAAAHGGGKPWVPYTYDPELNTLYIGTGNPNPVYAGQGRQGSDLYTASLVALDPDTGKMKWYFQGSPHDTHDWDQAEPPVLFDADINGQPRKLVAQASRNGYFFVLDRTNGKAIVSKPFVPLNWSLGVNSRGEPIPNPAKFPTDDGTMVSMTGGGATNWFPSSFDPQTGLFYVNTTEGYSIAYVQTTNTDAAGFAGRAVTLASHGMLDALDYRNGNLVWQHRYQTDTSEHAGILTTAGHLLFTGDAGGDLIAYDPAKGDVLWHVPQLGSVSNGPETYMLDGKQYLVVGAAGYLYAYVLAPAARPAAPGAGTAAGVARR